MSAGGECLDLRVSRCRAAFCRGWLLPPRLKIMRTFSGWKKSTRIACFSSIIAS